MVEVEHTDYVEIWSYGYGTWLVHTATGERKLLPDGDWELGFSDGVAALRCTHDTVARPYWANDLLERSLHAVLPVPDSSGTDVWWVQMENAVPAKHAELRTRITPVLFLCPL
eukprot:4433598-Amphidinium_carterae.1